MSIELAGIVLAQLVAQGGIHHDQRLIAALSEGGADQSQVVQARPPVVVGARPGQVRAVDDRQRCLAGGRVRCCRGAGVWRVLVLGADTAGDVFERRQRHTVSLAHVAEDVLHQARIAGARPAFAELGDERRPQGGMERGLLVGSGRHARSFSA